jgi:hypothetical protein
MDGVPVAYCYTQKRITVMITAPYHQNRKGIREAGCTECGFIGSVEIPDLTSLPEIHDEPVFDGYRKGGCRSGGGEAPKNVMKNDDFYRAGSSKDLLFYGSL